MYFSVVAQHYRNKTGAGVERPITLTKYAMPDYRPDMPTIFTQESPAQHRYPVWWTGDGVPLKASVESMVNAGVHDFKPYVHSDCGGDMYRPGKVGVLLPARPSYSATSGSIRLHLSVLGFLRGVGLLMLRSLRTQPGDLLRWTAHCAFGTIFRYHGGDHRPWQFEEKSLGVVATIRRYLQARYKLAPSLIAAGMHATATGFPAVVTRCDLFWPEHTGIGLGSAANGSDNATQYM
eukprot:SAG22_NODE_2118_length_2984_cov_2.031196_2_plen_235_part_00